MSWSQVESFKGLVGDLGDDLEVFVEMENGEPGQFGGSGDEDVGDRGRTVPATIGEQREHLNGTVLDGRGQVFDWHRRDRRAVQAGLRSFAERAELPHLQQRDSSDSHQATFDSCSPILLRGCLLPDERGTYVDQPHCRLR